MMPSVYTSRGSPINLSLDANSSHFKIKQHKSNRNELNEHKKRKERETTNLNKDVAFGSKM